MGSAGMQPGGGIRPMKWWWATGQPGTGNRAVAAAEPRWCAPRVPTGHHVRIPSPRNWPGGDVFGHRLERHDDLENEPVVGQASRQHEQVEQLMGPEDPRHEDGPVQQVEHRPDAVG